MCWACGNYLHRGWRGCWPSRLALVGVPAKPLGAGRICGDFCAARARNVRPVRTAVAFVTAERAGPRQRPRPRYRRVPDGRALGGDCRALRGRAAGGCLALYQSDARRGARRRGAVLDGRRHGAAADGSWRHRWHPGAPGRSLDGVGRTSVRRRYAGGRDLSGLPQSFLSPYNSCCGRPF
jgi:hypothetical protein